MVMKFEDLQGKASKAGPERFKPAFGKNKIRIVGSVVPAYKYWVKTRDGTSVPMDCLGFNRETETFDNKVKDFVRQYWPELKCSWAYMSYIIDREDGKVKIFDHKKRLFSSILDAAKKKMGDPTDFEKGWDVVFTKTKTGPKVFNVEYNLETFELENSSLSKEDIANIKEAGSIEDITKLATPEDQERFIKEYILDKEEKVDPDVKEELDIATDSAADDDLSF